MPASPGMRAAGEAVLPHGLQDWLQAYRHGAAPRELLARCLRRARTDSPRGVWIRLVSDDELERQLARLDAQRAAAGPDPIERLPLYGVPYAVKDNIDVAGLPTTAACPAFEYTARESAAVIERLEAAGAVCIGKTNLDQFATGLVGTRSPFGAPASVYSDAHVSGGSSSGSAVAVALGLVPFALGTDTAGSGRIPAAFNNIVGLKPTPGRVSTRGVVPACRSLDCVSVFARDVEAAAHVLSTIEGDDRDAYSRFEPGAALFAPAGRGLRVGIPLSPRFAESSGYAEPWAKALSRAESLGCELVPVDFAPLHETAALLYGGPWVAERQVAAGRLLRDQPDAIDDAVREVLAQGDGFSATDAFRAQHALTARQRELRALWNDVDLLLVPTAPGHPRFEEIAADPIGANSALGVYTNFVNLLGWCALSVPAGFASGGALPFGVTFIAPARGDAALAAFGSGWQALAEPEPAAAAHPPARIPLRRPAVRPSTALAVVGAHLSGMALNAQLVERGATLIEATATAPRYRLYLLPESFPPKPGLIRVGSNGRSIALEVWDVPQSEMGSFLALIPPPLGLGRVELEDGRWVTGFLCEGLALAHARDISGYGGWRAFMQENGAP